MSISPNSFPAHWRSLYSSLPAYEFFNGHYYFENQQDKDDNSFDSLTLIALPQLGLLKIEGVDAATFLQGQLTADVEMLSEKESVLGAHCDAKGRMHDNFVIHRQSAEQFLLMLPVNMTGIAKSALEKYAVFSKVAIENVTESFIAIATPQALNALPIAVHDSDYLTHYDNEFDIYLLSNGTAVELASALTKAPHQWRGSAYWEQHLNIKGIGFVQPETVGEFIPQMLNMDSIGGISFTKGCYTGQEIIARMKYRGNVKRRCYGFTCQVENTHVPNSGQSVLAPGADIRDANGAIVGSVVNAVAINAHTTADSTARKHWQGLAVIKLASAENCESLVIQPADHPNLSIRITLIPPPYAINN